MRIEPFADWPALNRLKIVFDPTMSAEVPVHRPSVEMYLCAFHVGKWEMDESVEEAYQRALDITAAQFHLMRGMIAALCKRSTLTPFIA